MEDYCKANFAISLERATTGISHLGLQAENEEELAEIETPVEAGVAHTPELRKCMAASMRALARDG